MLPQAKQRKQHLGFKAVNLALVYLQLYPQLQEHPHLLTVLVGKVNSTTTATRKNCTLRQSTLCKLCELEKKKFSYQVDFSKFVLIIGNLKIPRADSYAQEQQLIHMY